MNTSFKTAITVLLTSAILAVCAIACSDDRPPLDEETPVATDSDTQTEVDILQSDRKFITIALSRYRSDISSIDPSVLHPWCTHPDAESVTVPPKQRKSPPVPEYLPEGVSLHDEVHLEGKHYGSIYTSDGGNGNHIRLNVTHGTCLITSKAPEFIEQTSVAGNWGVSLSGAKGAGSFDLHFETDLGVVSISRVITGGKEETVTKEELIKIAESMPIFGGGAASADTQTEADTLVSPLGFIKVGFAGKSLEDVYPPSGPYRPRPIRTYHAQILHNAHHPIPPGHHAPPGL